MNNSDKIILDLCGGTGSWSRPYVNAGYDVRLITLPDNDVLKYKPPKNVYGILAAPPCTMFSNARTRAKRNRNLREGMIIVQAVLRIIWECQYQRYRDNREFLQFWAIENPKGLLVRFLGMPAWSFEQWQFGEMLEKKTYLWGRFNIPKTIVKEEPEIEKYRNHVNKNVNTKIFASPKCPDEYKHLKLNRSDIRAITPPGFAKAFYKANK